MANMDNIVTFDTETFKLLYPQFATLSDVQLNYYFAQACLLLNNTAQSPVSDLTKREILLNLLTCHIATLAQRGDVVGTLGGASEGSVSVSYTVPTIANAEYYSQTPCGLTYWQMSAQYRLGGLWFSG